MACDSLSDDDLLRKLRISFSDAPRMNQAQEDLRNLRQGENKSIAVYIYKWGHALIRSSGINAQNKSHPHIIKDFISAEKEHQEQDSKQMGRDEEKPCTIQEVFMLAANIETQIQVADSFKLDLTNDFSPIEVNEINTVETSDKEYEVNEMYKGKKWNNNRYRKTSYSKYQNSNNRYQQNQRQQDKRSGKSWENKEKDPKITLMRE